MSDKALMNRAALELTQKIQTHFPLDTDLDVLKAWNGCRKEHLQSRLQEVFSRMPNSEPLLALIRVYDISAMPISFIAKEKFVVDTSNRAKVKISYLGKEFQEKFLGKIESAWGSYWLRRYKLLWDLDDDRIISEIGNKNVIKSTLYGIFSLMEKQGHGQSGALLTNGHKNIFYIYNDEGNLWSVNCFWRDDGWLIYADCIIASPSWLDGDQVFM